MGPLPHWYMGLYSRFLLQNSIIWIACPQGQVLCRKGPAYAEPFLVQFASLNSLTASHMAWTFCSGIS